MVTEIVHDGENIVEQWVNVIENGSKNDFIAFAKQYNIFQTPRSKIYILICDKIKARLDREGLPYDTVRPD